MKITTTTKRSYLNAGVIHNLNPYIEIARIGSFVCIYIYYTICKR